MKQISTNLSVFLTILLLISPTWVSAQQVPQNRKWVAENPKFVEFSSAGIHFTPRDSKEGSDSVTTTLHLPAGKPWKVAFDVQMVPTVNGGMSVHLAQGKTELCWLGAGDYYKYISGFLGTGNGNMPFNQPWDNNWHSFAYQNDGKMLSLWHNGNKCGETTLAGTPDTLTVQSIGMELRVRNVHIEAIRPSDNPPTANSILPPTENIVINAPAQQPQNQNVQIDNTQSDSSKTAYSNDHRPDKIEIGEKFFREISTDSLATTYGKIIDDISSSSIFVVYPNGNTLPLYSYSNVNVNTTQKNPVLEYSEDSMISTTLNQVDLSQVDVDHFTIYLMPKSKNSDHYEMPCYDLMIHSQNGDDSFLESDYILGKWSSASKSSIVSVFFGNQEAAVTFVYHLCHAVHLINQNKSLHNSK